MDNFEKIINETESKVLKKLSDSGYILKDKPLQRTEEWFQQRLGKFTGSGIKKLMACTRATAKMEWGREEKIIDFSDTAIKYVYEKAMERKRNKVVQIHASAAMRYGTENEDNISKLFLQKNSHFIFKEVGFLEFLKNIAGASPDGLLIDKTNGEKFGYEAKAATAWDNVFLRIEIPFEEKHQDFWQIQSEMLALEVKSLYYCVAEPSEDIFEPNITDVQFKKVLASPIHQQSLIHRCKIGDMAIKLFLEGNINIYQSVIKAATNYDSKNTENTENRLQ